MKLVLAALATLSVLGCSSLNAQRSPTAPNPPASFEVVPFNQRPASIWLMVIDKDGGGVCLESATLEIIRGQGAGEIFPQEMPCDVWDFGGFELKGLPPGEELTFRIAASGYASKEITLVPYGAQSQATVIGLTKI